MDETLLGEKAGNNRGFRQTDEASALGTSKSAAAAIKTNPRE
jgi:hypothetical protein